MTTLEIHLPDEVNKDLEQFNLPKEEIVLSAVKSYLFQTKKDQLNTLLKEGYQAGQKENESLMKEFATVDLSNWYDY